MAAKGYWREISAILVFKAVAIVALYVLFVASPGPMPVTPDGVARHLAPAGAPQAGAAP